MILRPCFTKLVIVVSLGFSVAAANAQQHWGFRDELIPTDPYEYFGFSALDGNLVLSSASGATIRPSRGGGYVFDVLTGRQVQQIEKASNRANFGPFVELSKTTGVVRSTLSSRKVLDVFDLSTNELLTTIDARDYGGGDIWFTYQVDSNVIAFMTEPPGSGVRDIHFLDFVTGQMTSEIPAYQERSIWGGLDMKNGLAFVAGNRNAIVDVATGQIIHEIQVGENQLGFDVAISDTHALLGLQDKVSRDRTVVLIDLQSGERISELPLPNGWYVGTGALDIDGRYATVGFWEDGFSAAGGALWATVYDISTNEIVYEFESVDATRAEGHVGISAGIAMFSPRSDGPYEFPIQIAHLTYDIPGDFDNDGQVNASDVDLLSSVIRDGGSTLFDLNVSGTIDDADRKYWVHETANTYFGDANLDGEFNSGDFVTVFEAGEYEDGIAGNSGWADGDWNGDGDFTTADFVIAFEDGGYEQGPRLGVQNVPEPSASLLIWIAIIGLAAMQRSYANVFREST